MIITNLLSNVKELSRYSFVDREQLGLTNKITLKNPNGEFFSFELDNVDTVLFLKLWTLIVDHNSSIICTEDSL